MSEPEDTQKPRKKPNFAKLMTEGGGLSGFTWPENCGDFEMRIAADGTWFYRNSPIGRLELVKLFATTLQRDDAGQYWLVTPVERGLIQVDDAPFVIIEMQVGQNNGRQEISMRTNLDHWITIDSEHVLVMHHDPETHENKPYVHVRDNLYALVNRAVYYDLVEMAEWENNRLQIFSAGTVFLLGELEEGDAD